VSRIPLRRPRPRGRLTRLALVAGGGALGLTALLGGPGAAAPLPTPAGPAAAGLPVQLLALNDLHGNLDPVSGPAGAVTTEAADGTLQNVQAGGLAQMATLLDQARSGHPDSLTVGVGDMIGGSPLLSAAFHDEPTVDALETMGLDVTSVGNHEFDEGPDELLRIAHGGCHPKDGCADPAHPYDGADYPILAANVTRDGSSTPLLPPYWIKRLPNGEQIGFIGLTTRDTPSAVSVAGTRGLTFADEKPVIDRYADELDKRGVKAIVALVHEGGQRSGAAYDADCGPDAGQLSGRIKQIAERVSPKVDLILSGHSHEPYVCTVQDPAGHPRMVTQAASFGRTFTDVQFDIDPATDDVVRDSVTAQNHLVPATTPKQAAVGQVIDTWRARSAEMASRPVGYISGDLPGRGSSAPETPLGDLIADTQVEATAPAGAQLAFLNPGGMRADLVYRAQHGEGDGVVTYGEAFQVQPFDNFLVTMSLSGDQLMQVLREQFTGLNSDEPRILQLSDGLRYSVDLTRTGADRLLADTVRVNGEPVRPDAAYRVTVNTFLADGGNGFTTFTKGTDRVTGTTDLDAFTAYLKTHTSPQAPLAAPAAQRVDFR
jgi:5'-nucleotidase